MNVKPIAPRRETNWTRPESPWRNGWKFAAGTPVCVRCSNPAMMKALTTTTRAIVTAVFGLPRSFVPPGVRPEEKPAGGAAERFVSAPSSRAERTKEGGARVDLYGRTKAEPKTEEEKEAARQR